SWHRPPLLDSPRGRKAHPAALRATERKRVWKHDGHPGEDTAASSQLAIGRRSLNSMAPRTETTDDAFLGGALRILQPKSGYRAGIDALLLAASAGAQGQVLDVGAGVGLVGLALARRLVEARVLLVERDPGLAELARSNIERNGLGERVRVL